jgi:hypothetical protein
MRRKPGGDLFIGIVIICMGLFFLAKNFNLIPYNIDIGDLWPVALLAVGGYMIFEGSQKKNKDEDE